MQHKDICLECGAYQCGKDHTDPNNHNPEYLTHTPTPWQVHSDNGQLEIESKAAMDIGKPYLVALMFSIADCNELANAAYIVRAVNSYESNQKIKKELINHLKSLALILDKIPTHQTEVRIALALVAKAEGK